MSTPAPPALDDAPAPAAAERRHARRLLAALLVAGICLDLLVRSRIDGVAGTASVVAMGVAVLVAGRGRSRQSSVLVVLAVVLASFLSVRSSPWLVPLNGLVAACLLGLAAVSVRGGSLLRTPVWAMCARCARVLTGLVAAPAVILERWALAAPLGADAKDSLRAVARGVGLAVPLLVLMGALLASADAVFASFFVVPVGVGSALGHLVAIGAGIWVTGAVVWLVDDDWIPAAPGHLPRLGATETTVVLGGLVALYGLFVVAQVVGVGASESYILETTGLTRAEYARSGFFQLLWVAAITLAVLLALHHVTDAGGRPGRRIAALHAAAVVLTLAVVAVAIRRLGLYEDAYGLTMLRLYCTIFAWWLGAVFVVVGAYVARPWRRQWWPAAVGATAVASLVVLNVANPERLVVENNLERARHGEAVDIGYLTGLSADAVPALVHGLEQLDDDGRRQVAEALCGAPDRRIPAMADRLDVEPWFGHNRAVAQARETLETLCGERS